MPYTAVTTANRGYTLVRKALNQSEVWDWFAEYLALWTTVDVDIQALAEAIAANTAITAVAFQKGTDTLDDITEGSTHKILTTVERSNIADAFLKSTDDSDDVTEGATNHFISPTQEVYIDRIVSNNLYGEVATVSTATFSVNGTYSKLLVTYTDTGEVTLTFDASLKTDSDWAGVLIVDKGEGAYINNISMYVSGESDPFAVIDIDGDQVRVCSDGTNMAVEGFEA